MFIVCFICFGGVDVVRCEKVIGVVVFILVLMRMVVVIRMSGVVYIVVSVMFIVIRSRLLMELSCIEMCL